MPFNPPPGWPPPPPGWQPDADWQPPPSWPPAPPCWQFWVEPTPPPVPREVLMTKAANALVADADLKLHPGAEAALAPLGGVPAAVEPVLDWFKRTYGGLWVGGRVTLTTVDLTFAPNAMNRMVQSGTLDVTVPLEAITSVHVTKATITNIVVVGLGYQVLKVRCYGAAALAQAIEAAVRNRGTTPDDPGGGAA